MTGFYPTLLPRDALHAPHTWHSTSRSTPHHTRVRFLPVGRGLLPRFITLHVYTPTLHTPHTRRLHTGFTAFTTATPVGRCWFTLLRRSPLRADCQHCPFTLRFPPTTPHTAGRWTGLPRISSPRRCLPTAHPDPQRLYTPPPGERCPTHRPPTAGWLFPAPHTPYGLVEPRLPHSLFLIPHTFALPHVCPHLPTHAPHTLRCPHHTRTFPVAPPHVCRTLHAHTRTVAGTSTRARTRYARAHLGLHQLRRVYYLHKPSACAFSRCVRCRTSPGHTLAPHSHAPPPPQNILHCTPVP